jgi:hypothetical protein
MTKKNTLVHGLSQMHAILVLLIYEYSNINRWWILYKKYIKNTKRNIATILIIKQKYEKKHSKNVNNKAKIRKET